MDDRIYIVKDLVIIVEKGEDNIYKKNVVIVLVYFEKRDVHIEDYLVYSNEDQIYNLKVYKICILLFRRVLNVDLVVNEVEIHQIIGDMIVLKRDCKGNEEMVDVIEKVKKIENDFDYQVNYDKIEERIVFIHLNVKDLDIYMRINKILQNNQKNTLRKICK